MKSLTASEIVKGKGRSLQGRRLTILATALSSERGYVYGYELAKSTNILPHNLYPILIALENEGFLTSELMDSERGAQRRVYRIKNGMREELQKEVLAQLLANQQRSKTQTERNPGKLAPA